MAASTTLVHLPQTFPYPIRIVSLDIQPSHQITRGSRLLSYSFVHISKSSLGNKQETRFGTWDAAIEGIVETWHVRVGDIISQSKAKEQPIVSIFEPCKHGMQISGLCVLCGKDMTNIDYTGFSDTSRASIQMTHSAFGPTVSFEEAQRIEHETAQHLIKSRKLSLIVDLDQTIVHATVDPTTSEWLAEEEMSEAKQDIKSFRLGPESFLPPFRGLVKGKGKEKEKEGEGCMYYIKPRPGWKDFLEHTATKYEMHVYTMGTRAYAEEVCAAIDPDGKSFGGRILSRDESGSLTQKSLQRLFPCDTSMVVIIDDRADVWEWSPNLIKVIPYDFFVGIGDINSNLDDRRQTSVSPTMPEKLLQTALLKNDDSELERVAKLLDEVHERFFTLYDAQQKKSNQYNEKLYDVTRIIPCIRREVLEGVHILFSSVIPLDTPPDVTDVWRMAHMFGAQCSTELSNDVTHVVAAKRGTVKVDNARKRGKIKIVWLAWFIDSISKWRHLDETSYFLDDPHAVGPSSSPISDPHQISSDPDPDEDDWDCGPRKVAAEPSLELSALDWSQINAEVEEYLNETDDDEDARSDISWTKEGASEDETINGIICLPRSNLKRVRSVTPTNGSGEVDDRLSPLAKRKRIVADRLGASKLKNSISADDFEDEKRVSCSSSDVGIDERMEVVDEEDEDEDEDDFLGRELRDNGWS